MHQLLFPSTVYRPKGISDHGNRGSKTPEKRRSDRVLRLDKAMFAQPGGGGGGVRLGHMTSHSAWETSICSMLAPLGHAVFVVLGTIGWGGQVRVLFTVMGLLHHICLLADIDGSSE